MDPDEMARAFKAYAEDQMKEDDRVPDIVVQIQEPDIEQIYELVDKYNSIAHAGDKLARYRFWNHIHELYPQTIGKQCKLNTADICAPFIEVFTKD